MPHRDQEIAMLRRELEMLMGERQSLLRVVGASAVLIASLDSKRLPVGAVEAADQVATSIKESLKMMSTSCAADALWEASLICYRDDGHEADDTVGRRIRAIRQDDAASGVPGRDEAGCSVDEAVCGG